MIAGPRRLKSVRQSYSTYHIQSVRVIGASKREEYISPGRISREHVHQGSQTYVYGYCVILSVMENVQPHQPSNLSLDTRACWDALVKADLVSRLRCCSARLLTRKQKCRMTP